MGFEGEASSGCSADVLLLLPGATLLHSGLLTAALLLGACAGLVAAALIHTFLLKPRLLGRQLKGHDPWSLLEVEERDEETESNVDRKMVLSKPAKQKREEPLSGDVAAFALKAKVVYPINQRFRPLADGASNPSLHENPKPDQSPYQDSTSSSGDDWPSEDGEEDESSQEICSDLTPKSPESLSFRRALHPLHTLCFHGAEGRVSLLCVILQNLHQHLTELQQEKWSILLQVARALFNKEGDALQPDLQQLQQEIEHLKKGACPDLLSQEKGTGVGLVVCSIEEVEKAGRKKLEQTLHTAVSVAKQLEQLCQRMNSRIPNSIAQEMTRSLIHYLLSVEEQLVDIQTSFIKMLCNRLQWWEELSGWLRIKKTLLKQEAELRVKLTIQSLEELTADGQLGFDQMERLTSDLQMAVSGELQRCSEEARLQTEQLVREHCKKLDVKMRKVKKAQAKEWSHTLESHDHQQRDAQQLAQVLQELQVKQWKQRLDLQLQQDRSVSDSVCDLWKKLFEDFSGSVTDLWRECVLSTLTTSSALSVDDCQTLLNNTDLSLTNQIQRETDTHQHLQTLKEQLQRNRQVWEEEAALSRSCLNHLTSQHTKVTVATLFRQHDVQDRNLMEGKQRLLVTETHRILTARHFYIQMLREMKHAHLRQQPDTQILQQEQLSELETASELLQKHAQFLLSHALVHSTRQRLVDSAPENAAAANDEQKEKLKRAVCESVCVTADSVMAFITNYYSRIRTVATATQHSNQQLRNRLRERRRRRGEGARALQRELSNWARKPHSAEFYKRVEQQKRHCLAQCEEEEEEGVCEDRGKMMDVQHLIHTTTQELREEEDGFLSRLAALARVPLTDTQTTIHKGVLSPKTREKEQSSLLTSSYRVMNTELCIVGVPRRREMLQS